LFIFLKNCKYGNLCKNPKCLYIHTNLPQKSQLKWVAPSLAASAGSAAETTTSTSHQGAATSAAITTITSEEMANAFDMNNRALVAGSANENIQ
jgi:hypothetical protein